MEQQVVRMKNGNFWNRSLKRQTSLKEMNAGRAQGIEYTIINATKWVPCEFCGARVCSKDDTVCDPCDRAHLQPLPRPSLDDKHGRRCRLCSGPMSARRYFSCEQCIPDAEMPSDDTSTTYYNPATAHHRGGSHRRTE